jgi:hypothetical protein
MKSRRSKAPAVVFHYTKNQLNAEFLQRTHRLEQVRSPIIVANHNHSTRTEDAPHFLQRGNRLAKVLKHTVGEHRVEGAGGKWQLVHVGDSELQNIGRALLECHPVAVHRICG